MVFIIKNGFAERINIEDIFSKEKPITQDYSSRETSRRIMKERRIWER